MADVEALARAYLAAVVEIELPTGRAVVAPAPEGTVDGAFPADLGAVQVVTACNPYSQPLPDRDNAARNDRLATTLRAAGLRFVDAVGRSPDDVWREPSFAVLDGDLAVVLDLAARFEQHAVYRWTPHERTVVWAGAHRGRTDRQGWRRTDHA